MSILKLNNDCLEQVFIACEGCPFTLYTVSKVCRRWHHVSQCPSVWRYLKIDVAKKGLYKKFLVSESSVNKLNSVRTLVLWKSGESRHSHDPLHLLPLRLVTFTHLITVNLCFKEIYDIISGQLEAAKLPLYSLICKDVDPWCSGAFNLDMLSGHSELKHVSLQVPHDAFSHHTVPSITTVVSRNPHYETFSMTRIRDPEIEEQRVLIKVLSEYAVKRTQVHRQEDINEVDSNMDRLMGRWYKIESSLLKKYAFFSEMNHLKHLEFGNCYSWTPTIWKKVFKKVIISSPGLMSLKLWGWDHLGYLKCAGEENAELQSMRLEVGTTIAECFQLMTDLSTLRLIDFVLAPSMIGAGKFAFRKLRLLEVVITPFCLLYCGRKEDFYLFLAPLRAFILAVFPNSEKKALEEEKPVNIYVHPDVIRQIRELHFIEVDAILEPLLDIVNDLNVNVYFKEFP